MIGQMSSCWQIRGAVDSIALFQCHTSTIREKIFENTDFEQATDKFLCETSGDRFWEPAGLIPVNVVYVWAEG